MDLPGACAVRGPRWTAVTDVGRPGSVRVIMSRLLSHDRRAPTGHCAVFLLGNSGLRIWRERRVGNRAAQEIKGLLERTIVLLVWWYVGLRAGLFSAYRLEMAAQ